jgi:hypothetical protein
LNTFQQHTGHRQRLLGERGHLRQRLLGPTCQLAPDPSHSHLQQNEQWDQEDRAERQPPGQHDHRHQRGEDRDHVAQDGAGGFAEHRLHPTHVVGQPGLDRPGARRGEKRQIQPLQVLEQPPAQIGHHPVAQQRGLVGLIHPDQRGDHRDRHHPGNEPRQQPQPHRAPTKGEQRPVERGLGEERGDDAQPAGHQHRDHDRQQARAVGRE